MLCRLYIIFCVQKMGFCWVLVVGIIRIGAGETVHSEIFE